jgi:serine/threonine-protein kinase
MDRAGRVLGGKYRLVGLLGQGPTGEVYEARHGTLDRPCAVKVFHADVTAEPERVERAFADLRAATSIGHPGIVDVYDTDTTEEGQPYFVMELLEGYSLASRVGGGRRLSPVQAVDVVADALVALGIAHRRGLVHGDLKPQNLFVVQSSKARPAVRILDFGASRLVRTSDDRAAQFGAPQYWSPEQAAGTEELDHRTDIYAMGVVLYVCLTGRLPFDADDPQRVRARIVSRPFPNPLAVDPGLHPDLAQIVLRAASGYADERYGSAEGMLFALAPFLSPEARERLGLAAKSSPRPAGRTARAPTFPDDDPDAADEEDDMSMQGNRGSRTRDVGVTIALVSGPLALAAVIAVLIVLVARGGAAPPAPAQPTVVLAPSPSACLPSPGAPPAAPVAAIPAPVALLEPFAPAQPPPPPATVHVALQNLPAGAAVRVGGTEAVAGVAIVPRGDLPIPVSVSAPGFDELTTQVVPASDMVLAVALNPRPEPLAPAVPVPAPPEHPQTAAAPPRRAEPRPPATPPQEEPEPRVRYPMTPEELTVEAQATGTLRVQCNPWARVAVPGYGTHNTPFSMDLPAGHYRLLLANSSIPGGSRPRMVSVDVSAGETTKFTNCW